MGNSTEKAILAGGCFWGMQDLFRRFPGVISTRVGYTGGEVANATYRNHEGHAEAIEIITRPEINRVGIGRVHPEQAVIGAAALVRVDTVTPGCSVIGALEE